MCVASLWRCTVLYNFAIFLFLSLIPHSVCCFAGRDEPHRFYMADAGDDTQRETVEERERVRVRGECDCGNHAEPRCRCGTRSNGFVFLYSIVVVRCGYIYICYLVCLRFLLFFLCRCSSMFEGWGLVILWCHRRSRDRWSWDDLYASFIKARHNAPCLRWINTTCVCVGRSGVWFLHHRWLEPISSFHRPWRAMNAISFLAYYHPPHLSSS